MNNWTRLVDILKVMFLAVLLWFVITSWDDVIDRLFFGILKVDRNSFWSWVLVAMIHTLIALTIFLWLDVDLIETFGIHFNEDSVCERCRKQLRINS